MFATIFYWDYPPLHQSSAELVLWALDAFWTRQEYAEGKSFKNSWNSLKSVYLFKGLFINTCYGAWHKNGPFFAMKIMGQLHRKW